MGKYYKGENKVLVSVDCIIFGFENNRLKLLIGRRQMDPGRGKWSLYGGFVKLEESIDEAANRVLFQLTGLKNICLRQVGAFGGVKRDLGERVVSIAYCALINVKDYDKKLLALHRGEWVDLDVLPRLYSDHSKMVVDALSFLRRSIPTEPLGFSLLPKKFTLTQLQHVYEAILGVTIDKRNFRKKIHSIEYIHDTGLKDKLSSKRGAALYNFDMEAYNEAPFFKL